SDPPPPPPHRRFRDVLAPLGRKNVPSSAGSRRSEAVGRAQAEGAAVRVEHHPDTVLGLVSASEAPHSIAQRSAASRSSVPMSRWTIICCASGRDGQTGGTYSTSSWNDSPCDAPSARTTTQPPPFSGRSCG